MVAGNKVFGLISLEIQRPNSFTEEHTAMIQTFANQAGIAIEKAQLYQDALQAAERRAVLHRISQDIVRFSQDSEQIYVAIHDAAGKLMACDVFVITLRDEKKGENISVYTIEAGNRLGPQSVPGSRGLTGAVINEGKSIILRNDIEIGQRAVLHFGSPRHVQSVVAVPMRMGGRVIGMISAQSYEAYAYDIEEQALLEMLAAHAATAIENNRLFESELKRRREAETLRQAAAVISSTLDPNQVVKEILMALKQVIPYNNASVFFHEGDQLRIAMAHGSPHAEELTNLTFSAKEELFQQIQKTGRPIILPDAQKDSRFKNWGGSSNVHGWMAIPLVNRGKVIGSITLDSEQPGTYNEAIIETAMAFANQAAAGIENARLFQEQSRRSRIIEALADIANDIATTREVIPALDQIAQRALDLLNANHVAIYLLQEDNVTLKTVTARGMYRKELLSHTRKVGEGITGSVFLKGKPEIVNNTSEDPRRVIVPGTPEKERKLESLMASPLTLRGKTIGVINAWRIKENGLFNESELSFLVGIAHQVSICIESGRLFQETNRQAQEAAAIAEVGRDISATLQLDIVLERIASYAISLLHAETSAVYLADAATSTLSAIAALGIDSEAIKNDQLEIGTGILGNIALQNMGEIVNDTANDPRAIVVKGTEKNPLEHIMGVPILMKDKHTGLLAVWRSGTGTEFATRELEFLTSLARQAAVAIENARLYDETQRRLKELEIINQVSTSLRMTQSLEEMVRILLSETLQLSTTPHGSIWLYDHTSDKLMQRVASGSEAKIQHKSLSPMDGIIGSTFRTGKVHRSAELKRDGLLFEGNRESITPGLGAICIPIQSTAGPVGVLAIVIEREQQITEDINLLTILAEITGNAIHRAQLYDQSQKQVRRLTSLRDIDSAIASSFDLRLTLNILMDQTLSHLNVDAVNIGLYHPDLQSLTYLPGVGFNIPSPTRPQMRIGEGLAGQVIVRQQTCHITNLQTAPEASHELLVKREGFVTYIGIPLIVKGQIKGVFEVFHRSPLSPTPDWMEFLHTLAGQAAIAIDSSQLFENLQRSNQELIQAYDTTLEGWARALELRDRETEGHTRRVTELTMRLARYMGVGDNEMVNIYRGGLLHDIGKMGVPDHILKKKGKLTPEEWVEMRQHPTYAYKLLSPISFLRGVMDIPYCHHEHWDGSGYPRALKGEQIPLSARIFSVVDNWDALLSDRPYRKAWPREKVKAYLRESAGTLLDPRIVDIFLTMVEEDENQTG
jgi:GAF domain-containing protein